MRPCTHIIIFSLSSLSFLCALRSLFNIMTWRDPFLTFWIVVGGFCLILILHMMPWRIVLGALGVYVVGPQNWVIRVIRERKNGGPQAWNLDVILREKKKSILSSSGNHEEDKAHNRAFYFSSHTQQLPCSTAGFGHVRREACCCTPFPAELPTLLRLAT